MEDQRIDEQGAVAFVAGATGLTGRAVVQRLRALSIPTVAHVRPDSPRLQEWRQRFTGIGARVDSTPWTPGEIQATLRRVRPALVFALLGTTKKRIKGDGQDYLDVDFGLTAQLIDGCDEPLRFVYLSALGVGPKVRGAYLEARWKVEHRLRESGLRYTIARPSFIVGERDSARPLERAGAAVADGLLSVVKVLGAKTLAARFQSIDPNTLARGLVAAARSPDYEDAVITSDVIKRLAAG